MNDPYTFVDFIMRTVSKEHTERNGKKIPKHRKEKGKRYDRR